MSLLAREIQTKPVSDYSTSNLENLRHALRVAPVIQADNVMGYVLRNSRNGGKSLRIGSLAPPFSCFWVEYRDPNALVQCGTLFDVVTSQLPWQLEVTFFIDNPHLPQILPMSWATYELNEQGYAFDPIDARLRPCPGIPKEQHQQMINAYLGVAFLTVSFLHCKNVTLIPHAPDPALARRCSERGNPLPVKYHTIRIEPMKEVLRKEGRIEKVGLERALHICRGHFAHYQQDGPGLFGRGIHGDFWIPQHARGTEKRGVVIANYVVNPPRQ